MEIDDLRRLMANMESDRVERTVTKTDTAKFGQAICALSNDFPHHRQPGYLLVGVDDRTGAAVGLEITDRDLQTFGGLRSDGNILPLPIIMVERLHLSEAEGDVAVITVLPSDLPPVRYKGQCWIRIGPRRGIASESDERLLHERRTALAVTFDARPCVGATVADLAIDLFQTSYLPNAVTEDVLDENHRDVRA
ncbi:MAG: putative DNA binding domain-containing protein [Dehalococcoidia bacterium]